MMNDFNNFMFLKGENTLFENKPKNGLFTVALEGNIGCGKSTMLEHFSKVPCVKTMQEPLDQWTNLDGHNLLELLYKDPARWSFTFNNYAMLTRLQMHEYMPEPTVPVKLLERSLFSTQYVFVKNSHRNNLLTDLEHGVLTDWFNALISTSQVKVDLFVYLRASPEVCYQRLKKRNRSEEAGVPFEFIQQLHDLHEDWLIHETSAPLNAPVLVLDASCNLPEMSKIYEQYESRILCGCS